MALFTVSPVYISRNVIYLLETRKLRRSLFVTMLSSIYLVYLDIIIDPVALRGSRWFLGQIYGYPEAGAYFGVTIANFAGWVVVGFILTYLLQSIDYLLSRKGIADWTGNTCRLRYLIGPVLYAGILAFNIFMTFHIGENNIGWAGLFIIIMPAFLIWSITRIKMSITESKDLIAEHLKDFPEAEICITGKNR
jgi:putative membrane protein